MTRRKDGLWQEKVTFIVNGKKKLKYFYGFTKAEVNRKLLAYKERREKGVLFGPISDKWWDEHQPTLSPTAVPGYFRNYKYCKSWFGEVSIEDIKPLDVKRFMDKITTEHNMARKTAANLLIVLRLILRYAVREGYIDVSPAAEITVSKRLPKSERLLPDNSDITAIKTSLKCTFGLFAYFVLYTGLRKGEALALRWSDIDLTNRLITISKSVYQEYNRPYLKEPKTKAGTRTVPIPDKLAQILHPGKGLVFPNGTGDLMTEDQYRALYVKYRTESGVTCTAHQIRHLYATMLFENGIEAKDAQRILGHSQFSTTYNIYTHIRTERESIVNKKLMSIDITETPIS